jgi:hypothetical protein
VQPSLIDECFANLEGKVADDGALGQPKFSGNRADKNTEGKESSAHCKLMSANGELSTTSKGWHDDLDEVDPIPFATRFLFFSGLARDDRVTWTIMFQNPTLLEPSFR